MRAYFYFNSCNSWPNYRHRGHLKVLRWLRDSFGEGCTSSSEGLEAAAAAGHVRVVAWILRNRYKTASRRPCYTKARKPPCSAPDFSSIPREWSPDVVRVRPQIFQEKSEKTLRISRARSVSRLLSRRGYHSFSGHYPRFCASLGAKLPVSYCQVARKVSWGLKPEISRRC